jgi:hypothetical protein
MIVEQNGRRAAAKSFDPPSILLQNVTPFKANVGFKSVFRRDGRDFVPGL